MRGEFTRNILEVSIVDPMTTAHDSPTLIGNRPTSLLVRVGKCAPPDLLVNDVGHFSPACIGLLSSEGVGHRLLLLADEGL